MPSHNELIDRIRLARSPNVGAITFKKLMELFGTATEAIQNLPRFTKHNKDISVASVDLAQKEWEMTQSYGASILCWDDDAYPRHLLVFEDSPPIIIAKGQVAMLNHSRLAAIVGARNASTHALGLTKQWSNELAQHGVVIVSGLAQGVDTQAHMSGVAKEGTIAVMASGIDVCYPKQNSSLKGQIEENGVVVTEYAFGATPIAQRFPQRNRIIAALGHAVIVIEASLKSGSLITAQYAHKYSKTLFAVPGSPLDARYGGCNALIKEGKARLLTTPQEVIDYLCNFNFAYNVNDGHSNIFSSSTLLPSEGVLLKYRESVRDAISFAPTSMEQIMLTTKVDYSTLNVLILEMELCGLVQRLYGNVIVRLPI